MYVEIYKSEKLYFVHLKLTLVHQLHLNKTGKN